MKKLIIIILFLNISKTNFAQLPVTDTIGYLRDSIEAKRAYYIGKPLSVLLNNLRIEVKSYTARVPFSSEPDTFQFRKTTLDFYNNGELITIENHNIISPHIDIVFTPPIL